MYILGVSQGHDASAALLKDGTIIAAAEEERFNRIKHSVGKWAPVLAARFCLQQAGITADQVDYVAVDQESPTRFYAMQLGEMFPRYLLNRRLWSIASRHLYHSYQWQVKRNAFHLNLGFPKEKFRFIRHHDAHAASAFLCSGFDRADVLILDGVGETDATSLYKGEGESFRPIRRVAAPNSLGLFYGGVTMYLGYEFAEGEGKVMGLAPYGEVNATAEHMERFCRLTPDGYKIDGNLARYDRFPVDLSLLQKHFGEGPTNSHRLHEFEKYRNIAFALQQRLEETGLHLLKAWGIGETLCLAGGVALNCKMNGVLLQKGGIKDIFIQPAASDAGGSLGAALALANQLGIATKHKMEHVYFGPEYRADQIEPLLEKNKLSYEKHRHIEKAAAELLAKNKIVGWFQGRMEMGPRALGNRSILMSPAKAENKDIINAQVKFREPFRPFCPSMLAEAASEYLVNPYPSPFMILSFEVPKEKRKEIPAVVHVDGSCRPQTVEKHVNPRYWKLIKSFENETGVPVLLNTSLNIKGEPMVCSPREALNCFFLTGMDTMVLGDYLVRKK